MHRTASFLRLLFSFTLELTLKTVLSIGFFYLCYFGSPNLALSTPPLPGVQSITYKGYLRPNGSLVVNETIVFNAAVEGNNFSWQIPQEKGARPFVSIDGSRLVSAHTIATDSGANMIGVKSNQKGMTYLLTYTLTNAIITQNDLASLRWQIISQPSVPISRVDGLLSLPFVVPKESITSRIFATNNITRSNVTAVDGQTISFQIDGVGSNASAAVSTQWPKLGLQISLKNRLTSQLTKASIVALFTTTIALPLVAIVILIGMAMTNLFRERLPRLKGQRETPPTSLAPAMLGTLLHKELRHDALLATIFDLAARGYIDMFEKDGHFNFGQRKQPDDQLLDWEAGLLAQVFQDNDVMIEKEHLKRRAQSRLFSPHIASLYESVYDAVAKQGYFVSNPHLIRTRYKLLGLGFYFFSLISFFFLIVTNQPYVLLLPVTSLFLASFIILRLARVMPERSQAGKQALAEWLQFRAFLRDREPLPLSESMSNLFFAYLPYALVLGVEQHWINRFRQQAVMQPAWFVSLDNHGVQPFTEHFVQMVDEVSKTFVMLHGPIVE